VNRPLEAVTTAARELRGLGVAEPDIAFVLGSGLAGAAAGIDLVAEVDCAGIAGFRRQGVEGHFGRIRFGRWEGVRCLAYLGRPHAYEGLDADALLHPVRVAARLGVKALVSTCAAGGIRSDLEPGALVLVTDHIDWCGPNPLRGAGDARLGESFVDLSAAYDPGLRAALLRAAETEGIELSKGVYARTAGPSYETPAEIRALERLGADLVGMSLVPEIIGANEAGLEAAAIAVVSNRAAGRSPVPLSHREVLAAGESAAADLGRLLESFLRHGRVR